MRRTVRSYVLRQGRVTGAQERALAELMPAYGIAYREENLDPRAVFGRGAPLVLEIGSGMGETTARIAKERPDTDFIAVEVHGPGVGSLLKLIEQEQLGNVRVIRHDALEVLEHMIPDGSLAGIHLFFPDPWPKKRHHKRRLVQPAFAALAARKLAPGGALHAATDWEDYAAQIVEVLMAEPGLRRDNGVSTRPPTKFELRGLKLGHKVHDFVFRRRS
ncbi:MAG TPA: tRNA (guanosine(46)-N7)-methyltransferase TrmB [Burkholderiales bacterium]|nr:tRNA (guanosine(46)-N7)-methyltransferase TrmB [Burkholderiales bacterium]